jgi:cell division protein FtsB
MWREFFAYAAAIVAVANGVIAMIVAWLPVRTSVHKLRLGAVALGLAAVAVGATAYAKYHSYAQSSRLESDRTEIRKRLDTLSQEGRALFEQIKDAQRELPSKAADEWAQRTENFLRDNVGASYVPRFRQDQSDLYGVDLTIQPSRAAYWRAVRDRMVNLDAIRSEFPVHPWQPPR